MTSGEQGAVWRLVLDANVLLQAPLRDTLLRLAQARIVTVFWSEAILAEVERNFAAVSGTTDATQRFARLLAALRHHFPDALVLSDSDDELPSAQDIPRHDRHVLTCALAAPAPLILTYNTRHFPASTLVRYGVRAWHPDTLLADLLRQRPDELRAILLAQGADLHPPRSLGQVLERFSRDVPQSAALARQRYGM